MKKKLLAYGISFLIGAAIALLVMGLRGIFTETEPREIMRLLSDAFFVPGVVLAGVGLLVFATNGGVFDMLVYSVILFFNLFRRNVQDRKYRDFYEYREAKKDRKRRSLAFLLIVGLLYIALAALFLILYGQL